MTTQRTPAQVSTPSESAVEVVRTFDARRELVWKAYTTPNLVQRWLLGPPGWSMPVCEMDVRVGGEYRWVWRSDDGGQEFGFHGEFIEVVEPERIVHSETYDPGDIGGSMGESGTATVTLTLEEADGTTTMTTHIDYGSGAARDAALSSGMTDGMEMSYRNLDALLAEEG